MLDIAALPPFAWLALTIMFAAVAMVVATLAGALGRDDPARRLSETKASPSAAASGASARALRSMRRSLRPLEKKITPSETRELSQVRRRLVRAGFYDRRAVGAYFLTRLGLAVLLPLAFTIAAPLLFPTIALRQTLFITLGLALLGYMLPAIVTSHIAAKRQIAVRQGFPDALDLMLVCVEAGLGLDAAIARVAQEIGTAHPLLREHFHLMSVELQTGKSREEALRAFAERIGLDDVDAFATLLIQSDSLGASVADTLRALSDDMRQKRMLSAEEKAQQLGVKLTFPLIIMIMPALMLTVGTPAILQLMRKVGPVIARFGGS